MALPSVRVRRWRAPLVSLLPSILFVQAVHAQTPPGAASLTPQEAARYQVLVAKKPHELAGNAELAELLSLEKSARGDGPLSPPARLAHWAQRWAGQPYRLYSGVFDLAESDCITFTERTIALGCTDNWNDYSALTKRLRYKEGVEDVLECNYFPLAEGTPPGRHQNWTPEYEAERGDFIENNREATAEEVRAKLNELLGSGNYP